MGARGRRAYEPSVIARMSGRDFIEGLREHPDLAISMLSNLAAQLQRTNARLSARNSEHTSVRAGHRLLELAGLMLRLRCSVGLPSKRSRLVRPGGDDGNRTHDLLLAKQTRRKALTCGNGY